ncbi:MAG: NAD(P)-dependent oxidoreductase, partial [Alphaproteobacteria bacterium]
MSNSKPVVVVTRKLPEVVETRMKELFEAHLNRDDAPMPQKEILKAVRAADVLVPTVTDRIDAKLIAKLPERVRLIANFGVGVDHIDLDAAFKRGLTVTNTPDVLTEDTADMAMTLILAASRRLGEGERLARSGKWTGWAPTFMMGHRIWGKRLGIVGMGRIGQALARRTRGFGM